MDARSLDGESRRQPRRSGCPASQRRFVRLDSLTYGGLYQRCSACTRDVADRFPDRDVGSPRVVPPPVPVYNHSPRGQKVRNDDAHHAWRHWWGIPFAKDLAFCAGARHLRRGVLPRVAARRQGAEPGRRAVGLGELPRRGRGGLRAGEPALDGPGAPVPALAGIQPADDPRAAGCRSGTAMPAAGRLIWPTARARSSTRSTCWPTSGPTPDAYAWIAAGRLLVAGLGMFLLARSWGLRLLGTLVRRAGLSRSAASWSSGCSSRSRPWRSGCPGCSWRPTGCSASPGRGRPAGWRSSSPLVILGGHIQTSAHVLLAGGLYAAWRWVWPSGPASSIARRVAGRLDGGDRAWASGWRPSRSCRWRLYLAKSPVWGDRRREQPAVVDDRPAAAARRRLHGGALCLREPAPGASQPGPGPGRAQPERVGGRLSPGWRP